MRYYGGGPVGMGNAGVFNNASIGATPAGQGPSFPIDQEAWNEADRIKIDAIPRGDVLKRFLEIRGAQKLKGASVPVSDPMGSIGNLGGLQNAQFFEGAQLAQAYPGGQQLGNTAGMLGGDMAINPALLQEMAGAAGPKPPITFGLDIENDKVKALKGQVNTQLDANQRLNFGGEYNVQDQSGRFGVGYQTPTFGFDVNLTRTSPMPNAPRGYGAMMNMGGRF